MFAETRQLKGADRPSKCYSYSVAGRGQFPIDMLRYDGAWPADPDSVDKLTTFYWDSKSLQETRTVWLRSHRAPTPDRWASFGWSLGGV